MTAPWFSRILAEALEAHLHGGRSQTFYSFPEVVLKTLQIQYMALMLIGFRSKVKLALRHARVLRRRTVTKGAKVRVVISRRYCIWLGYRTLSTRDALASLGISM